MKFILFLLLLSTTHFAVAQDIVRDIKSFGAKGDGITNDHEAFRKAADFFNKAGGNGKLIISPGIYIVGEQKFNQNTTTVPVYLGTDVLAFDSVKNFIIEGRPGAIIRFAAGLRFGTFDPKTGLPNNNGNNFLSFPYIGEIGNAISFTNSKNIIVRNLELDGNNSNILLGGIYGDYGRQLPHSGILITNTTSITIDGVNAHHFGLDGIIVSNKSTLNGQPDKVTISNSSFEYNARQGLSWVGGNDLAATNCKFNQTGKGKFMSPPGAGLDIEAEVGPVKNGTFQQCEFINNSGVGAVADMGESSNCTFTDCTFWGITIWSIWINRPGFTFNNSRIYGSVAHGFNASNDNEATKFFNCLFEDKPYNGQEPYGKFLIETNYRRRMRFENCTMLAHKQGCFWMETDRSLPPEEKYQLINCKVFQGDKPVSKEYLSSIPFLNVK